MLHVYGLTAAVREDREPQAPRGVAEELAQAVVQAPDPVVARWSMIHTVNSKGFLVSRFVEVIKLD